MAASARFDGTNDFMARGGGLTGVSDTPYCLMSFWVKFNGGDGSYQQIFEDQASGTWVQISRTNTNKLAILLKDQANTGGGTQTSTSNFDVAAGWKHVLYSWDMTPGTAPYGVGTVNRFMVNDVDEWVGAPGFSGGISMNYTQTDWFFGARSDGNLKCNMDIAEFYFNIATSMDLSVTANRRKFISATGGPVALGSNGQTPTGTAPLIYFKGPGSSFNTNLGGGGNFTVTGALTAGADTPTGTATGDLKLYAPVLDSGLADLANANKLYICSQVPTTYAEATTGGAYALGNANVTPGAPAASGSGRQVTVPAITAGSVTNTGTPTYWALVRTGTSALMATGQLTGVALTSGQTFTLQALTIIQAGVSV